MVRLALLLPREGQLDADLRPETERRPGHLHRARALRLDRREEAGLSQLHQLHPGEPLRPMVRQRMGDLVGQHDREPVLVLGDGKIPLYTAILPPACTRH